MEQTWSPLCIVRNLVLVVPVAVVGAQSWRPFEHCEHAGDWCSFDHCCGGSYCRDIAWSTDQWYAHVLLTLARPASTHHKLMVARCVQPILPAGTIFEPRLRTNQLYEQLLLTTCWPRGRAVLGFRRTLRPGRLDNVRSRVMVREFVRSRIWLRRRGMGACKIPQ